MIHKLHTIHDPCINPHTHTHRTRTHAHTHTMVTTKARLCPVTLCRNSHLHRQQQTALFVATCSPRRYWIVTEWRGRVLRHGSVDVTGNAAAAMPTNTPLCLSNEVYRTGTVSALTVRVLCLDSISQHKQQQHGTKRYFRLPPRSSWERRSSGLLRSEQR